MDEECYSCNKRLLLQILTPSISKSTSLCLVFSEFLRVRLRFCFFGVFLKNKALRSILGPMTLKPPQSFVNSNSRFSYCTPCTTSTRSIQSITNE